MLNEREIYLLNAGVDGELSADEQLEHDRLLEQSAEARVMRAELQKLSNILESLPEQHPPEGMAEHILDQAAPASRLVFPSLSGFFSSLQPKTAGVAFAAGLLLTVAAYEWTPGMPAGASQDQMVGTLLANRESGQWQTIDTRDIVAPGLQGQLALRQTGNIQVLAVNLHSEQELQMHVRLGGPEASRGNVLLQPGVASKGRGRFEFTGGAVNVVSQGEQTFEIYMPITDGEIASNRAIEVGISASEAQLFSATLGG